MYVNMVGLLRNPVVVTFVCLYSFFVALDVFQGSLEVRVRVQVIDEVEGDLQKMWDTLRNTYKAAECI